MVDPLNLSHQPQFFSDSKITPYKTIIKNLIYLFDSIKIITLVKASFFFLLSIPSSFLVLTS